jgi:gluconolactonase
MRVADDLVKPNGIIGTPDGRTLYIADHGAGQTYGYDIASDGSLSGKTLVADRGSDGMTLDTDGNLFLDRRGRHGGRPYGREIERIFRP